MNKNYRKFNKGLTLVELLVVISIFLVITAVTVFEYGSFRSNVSLQNLTDDIAMAVRKAQSFAIGARAVKDEYDKTNFDNSFGIHFSISSTEDALVGSNKSFLMFSVPPESTKKYNYSGSANCGDPSNDCVELFRINTADYIKEIIVDDVIKDSSNTPEASLDVVFTRPDPRAYFCYRADQNISTPCESASNIKIKISNGEIGEKEKTRIISIQNTGQISTQQE